MKVLIATASALALLLAILVYSKGSSQLSIANRYSSNSGALPVLGKAPFIQGIDSKAASFDSRALAGKILLVTFFFSHCTSTCPKQNSVLSRISEKFANESRIGYVSISVNPDQDTPKVLEEYAQKLSADSSRWHFVRVEYDRLKNLMGNEGFKLQELENPVSGQPSPEPEIIHTTRIVLIDSSGNIRAYVDGTSDDAQSKLESYINELLS